MLGPVRCWLVVGVEVVRGGGVVDHEEQEDDISSCWRLGGLLVLSYWVVCSVLVCPVCGWGRSVTDACIDGNLQSLQKVQAQESVIAGAMGV